MKRDCRSSPFDLCVYRLAQEAGDLSNKNDGHNYGNNELEADIQELGALELEAFGGFNFFADHLGAEYPADEDGHDHGAEGHENAFCDEVIEVQPVSGSCHYGQVEHNGRVVHPGAACYVGAETVKSGGQAYDEGDNSHGDSHLLTGRILTLSNALVDEVSGANFQQRDGGSDSSDENQQVEHEAQQIADEAVQDLRDLMERMVNSGIYLDTGALVGGLARPMDKKLGQIQAQKARA